MEKLKFEDLIMDQLTLKDWKERALKAEELIYDFVSGKTDETPLIEYIQKSLDSL